MEELIQFCDPSNSQDTRRKLEATWLKRIDKIVFLLKFFKSFLNC